MASKDKLPVMDIFGPTIQGEGYMCGQPTWFVRFAGCDYNCIKCDTMYAVDPKQYQGKYKHYTSEELVQELLDKMGDSEWVTFTGGNPAMWPLKDVVLGLHAAGKFVAVETQGAFWPKDDWVAYADAITVSPKGPSMIQDTWQVMQDLDAFMFKLSNALSNKAEPRGADGLVSMVSLKFPIFDVEDMLFAKHVIMKYPAIPAWLSTGNFSYTGEKSQEALTKEILQNTLHVFDMMQDPKFDVLKNCRILPQLHVLLWGNAPGR